MMRQMSTPAKASPMIAPLDSSCDGAYPERSTPVRIQSTSYMYDKYLRRAVEARQIILRF